MLKIISIVGARPQFIKAAIVSRRLRKEPDLSEVLIHTGQHYDERLSAIFFDELEIPEPEIMLGIGSASHGEQTGRMMAALEPHLVEEKPDCVLVYGDANSTLAGALTAAKLGFPVAHVEAGLRSFNRSMPEEINRVLTDHLAEFLFATTEAAVRNLEREGLSSERVFQVGDVMLDASLLFGDMAETRSEIMKRLELERSGYILATVHRAENTDDPHRLKNIFDALEQVSLDIPVVGYPCILEQSRRWTPVDCA